MLAKGQPVPIAGSDDEPFSILADDGTIKPGTRAPEIPDEVALKLYRGMLQVRLVDDRMMKLQRQGRLGFSHVVARRGGDALRRRVRAAPERLDLPVLPRAGRRVLARLHAQGLRQPAVRQRRGSGQGPADAGAPLGAAGSTSSRSARRSARRSRRPSASRGRRSISKKDDVRARLLRRGRDVDGRVPRRAELRRRVQGAVHLLLPQQRLGDLVAAARSRRRRESFADQGLAYGMPGVRVDGNDLSRHRGRRRTRRRARARGEGRRSSRRVTYRRGGHSSTDDPSVYRDPAEPKEWEAQGSARALAPLPRDARAVERRSCTTSTRRRSPTSSWPRSSAPSELGRPPVESMFDDVFDELPSHLQRAEGGADAHCRARSRSTEATETPCRYGTSSRRSTTRSASRCGATRASSCSARTSASSAACSARRPGLLRRVRRRPRDRHAARRGRHHRHRDRHGALRPACRCRRSSSPTSSIPAYDQIVNELAKFRYRSGGAVPVPGRDPHAGRRRHPRRPLPLAVARGASSSTSPGLKVVVPVESVRRQGPAARVRSATRIRCSSSSRSASTARPRARSPRATTRSRSARPRSCARARSCTVLVLRSDGVRARSRRRERRRGAGLRSEVIDLRTLCRSTSTTILDVGEEDRPRA